MTTTRILRTIDDALLEMNAVIVRCRQQRTRLGFFAVLYRDVTLRVKAAIAAGRFQDGARMERLDAIFAARYLEAVQQLWAGSVPSRSWRVAFDAATQPGPIVLLQNWASWCATRGRGCAPVCCSCVRARPVMCLRWWTR